MILRAVESLEAMHGWEAAGADLERYKLAGVPVVGAVVTTSQGPIHDSKDVVAMVPTWAKTLLSYWPKVQMRKGAGGRLVEPLGHPEVARRLIWMAYKMEIAEGAKLVEAVCAAWRLNGLQAVEELMKAAGK